MAPNKKQKYKPKDGGGGGGGDDDDNGDDPDILDNEDIVDSEDEDDIEDMIRTDDDVKEQVSNGITTSQSKLHQANTLVHSIKLFIWRVEKSSSAIKEHHLKVRNQAMYLAQFISICNAGGSVEVEIPCLIFVLFL